MTVAIVNSVVSSFLGNAEPGVLVLKGAWGVGKTYAWRKLVKEHKKRIKMKGYCYLSLFGMTSISALQTAIFTKTTAIELLDESLDATTVNNQFSNLLSKWGKQIFSTGANVIKDLPYGKNLSIGIETIAPYLIRDTLICLDDFERLSVDSIKSEELLGFLSELKEEKGCKIVLIFNEEKLPSKDVYQKYREKVVEIELLYAPTAKEAFELAVPEGVPCRELLGRYAISLGVTNIRILRKIVNLVSLVFQQVSCMHQKVMEQAVMTIVLLAWCYYDPSEKKPTYRFIVDWNRLAWGIKKAGGEEQNAQEAAWATILQNYGLLHIDEFDQTLARVVECGYLEGTGFAEESSKLNLLMQNSELEQSFTSAWRMFHDTFDDNREQLVNALYENFKISVNHISPMNLNGTAGLLRHLGEGERADELIEYYIKSRGDEEKLFDLKEYPFADDISDQRVRESFAKKFSETYANVSLSDAVAYIVTNGSWSQEHIDALTKANEDDFFALFKQPHGEQLNAVVRCFLKFAGFDQHQSIGEKARAALKRIGQENVLNAIRVKRYGIEVG